MDSGAAEAGSGEVSVVVGAVDSAGRLVEVVSRVEVALEGRRGAGALAAAALAPRWGLVVTAAVAAGIVVLHPGAMAPGPEAMVEEVDMPVAAADMADTVEVTEMAHPPRGVDTERVAMSAQHQQQRKSS